MLQDLHEKLIESMRDDLLRDEKLLVSVTRMAYPYRASSVERGYAWRLTARDFC